MRDLPDTLRQRTGGRTRFKSAGEKLPERRQHRPAFLTGDAWTYFGMHIRRPSYFDVNAIRRRIAMRSSPTEMPGRRGRRHLGEHSVQSVHNRTYHAISFDRAVMQAIRLLMHSKIGPLLFAVALPRK